MSFTITVSKRGRWVWRQGGNSGSQPRGGASFDPAGGGPKNFVRGGDRGGNTDKKFLKFQRRVKILHFSGKYSNFWSPLAARGGTVLHKGVHQGGEMFLDLQGGHSPLSPPPLRPHMTVSIHGCYPLLREQQLTLNQEDACHVALGVFRGFRGLSRLFKVSGQQRHQVAEEACSEDAGNLGRGRRSTGLTRTNSIGSGRKVGWGFWSLGPLSLH